MQLLSLLPLCQHGNTIVRKCRNARKLDSVALSLPQYTLRKWKNTPEQYRQMCEQPYALYCLQSRDNRQLAPVVCLISSRSRRRDGVSDAAGLIFVTQFRSLLHVVVASACANCTQKIWRKTIINAANVPAAVLLV